MKNPTYCRKLKYSETKKFPMIAMGQNMPWISGKFKSVTIYRLYNINYKSQMK